MILQALSQFLRKRGFDTVLEDELLLVDQTNADDYTHWISFDKTTILIETLNPGPNSHYIYSNRITTIELGDPTSLEEIVETLRRPLISEAPKTLKQYRNKL